MIRLLNSAMMPRQGEYSLREVSPQRFGDLVRQAYDLGQLVSYIGYPQTAKVIERLVGVPIAVSRESTSVDDGDVLLIARLRYRIANPATKGKQVLEDVDFFEFFRCSYRKKGESE